MKNSASNWFTILLTAVIGVLFIVWHNELSLFNWLIVAIGVLLVLPALFYLISAPRGMRKTRNRQDGRLSFGQRSGFTGIMLMAVASLVVGVWMILDPSFFVKVVAYLFAASLVISGLYQIFSSAFMSRPYRMPWGFYIVPLLMVAAGVCIFCTSVSQLNSAVALITGILLVASAVNGALQCMAIYRLPLHEKDADESGDDTPAAAGEADSRSEEEAKALIAEHSESTSDGQ